MKTSYFPSKYHTRVFYIALVIFFILLFLKGNSQIDKQEVVHGVYYPDGQKIIDLDTTKPKQIFHHYILKGSDTMFILLQNLILSPGDVTPNQKNNVIGWFNANIKIDSTKK